MKRRFTDRERKVWNLLTDSHSDTSRQHVNCVRVNTGSTFQHEATKFRKCWRLLQMGHLVITEAKFKNGCRADILDLTAGIAYEIVKSESMGSISEKRKKYPVPIMPIICRK